MTGAQLYSYCVYARARLMCHDVRKRDEELIRKSFVVNAFFFPSLIFVILDVRCTVEKMVYPRKSTYEIQI